MPNPYEPPTVESTDGAIPHTPHSLLPSRETETVPDESLTVAIARLFIGAAAVAILATVVLTTVAMSGYWIVSWYTRLMGI